MSSSVEEKGNDQAGETKYCEICNEEAYKYIFYFDHSGYVCYDCYEIYLINITHNNELESKFSV